MPWLFKTPSPATLWWSAAGGFIFLAIFTWALRKQGDRLLAAAIGILVLAFALGFTGANWTVIAIFAAAFIGDTRPAARAVPLVVLATAAAGLFSFALGQIWPWGLFGILMMFMVGLGNVRRASLDDTTTALTAAHEQVRLLATSAERERIGRDLHDLLGRTLTLVTIKSELAAKLAPRDAVRAAAEMQDIAQQSRDALDEVRAAVAGMTGAGLTREVEQSRAALSAAGIVCIVEGEAATVAGGAGAILAMALREAVTNVIRHSGARTCHIRIEGSTAAPAIIVEDDGDGAAICEGGGIGGIRARLSAAGGALVLAGSAVGTRLTARLPGMIAAR